MSYSVTYIGASWCKVCVDVKPEVEKLCTGFNVPLLLQDADDDGVSVKKVPTVRFYKDGVLVEEITTGHVIALRTHLTENKGLAVVEDF